MTRRTVTKRRKIGRPTIAKNGVPLTDAERAKRYRKQCKVRRAKRNHGVVRGSFTEWYTPPEIIAAARRVMKRIDVDPSSCDLAQTVVKARKYRTATDNGLNHEWRGTIWLNPPYTRGYISLFVDKLLIKLDTGRTTSAILLTRCGADTKWFRKAATAASAICFPSRLKFCAERAKRYRLAEKTP